MKKAIELAKKLKALADRGEGGEKYNAQEKLKELLTRTGLTYDDLESEHKTERFFPYKKQYELIMMQCILYVMGKDVNIWDVRNRRTRVCVECSISEEIEIKAMYEFYSRAFQKELKLFQTAFIYKNNLLPPDAGESSGKSDPEEVKKIRSMMDGIEKSSMRKQLDQ